MGLPWGGNVWRAFKHGETHSAPRPPTGRPLSPLLSRASSSLSATATGERPAVGAARRGRRGRLSRTLPKRSMRPRHKIQLGVRERQEGLRQRWKWMQQWNAPSPSVSSPEASWQIPIAAKLGSAARTPQGICNRRVGGAPLWENSCEQAMPPHEQLRVGLQQWRQRRGAPRSTGRKPDSGSARGRKSVAGPCGG
jgi:hypothetical protein